MKAINRSWFSALSVIACMACGDDTSDTQPTDPGLDASTQRDSSGGAGGTGKTGASSGSGSSSMANGASNNASVAMAVKCGAKMCTSQGGFAAACCADEKTETCGTSFMGGGCSVPEPGDERCPGVMGFVTLPSCCTDDGMCGINASMFGMPGCIELGAAAARAQMTSASAFPKPQACDGRPIADGDAGVDADGGS